MLSILNKPIKTIKVVFLACIVFSIFSCRDIANIENNNTTIEPVRKTQFNDINPYLEIREIIPIGKDGSFVVLWWSNKDEFDGNEMVQTFDKDGNPISKPIVLKNSENEGGMGPLITSNPDNEKFTVAFRGYHGTMTLQTFDKYGNKIGKELAIGENKKEANSLNLALFDKNNDFLISWDEYSLNLERDGSFVQKFDANNKINYDKVKIKKDDGNLFCGFIGNNGDFICGWTNSPDLINNHEGFISLQRFDQYGNAIGDEIEVTHYEDYIMREIIRLRDNFLFVGQSSECKKTDIVVFSNTGKIVKDKITFKGCSEVLPTKSGDFVTITSNEQSSVIQKFNKFGDEIADKIHFSDQVDELVETKNGFFGVLNGKNGYSFQEFDEKLNAVGNKIKSNVSVSDNLFIISLRENDSIMIFYVNRPFESNKNKAEVFVQKINNIDF